MPLPDRVPDALAITLFGPLQVRVQGHPLPPLRSRKPLWLLVLLTLRHERPVEREWLAGTLWPEVDQSRAFANLRPVLSELRSALATESARIQSPDRHTLVLDLTDAEVDLLRFDAAIASGTLFALKQAVALYRGPLLEGCTEEWVAQEREAREQAYLQALKQLGDASLAADDYGAAAGYYQQIVRIDPWQEATRRRWMEALSRNGDINAALQVYREFITFLKDDPKAVPDEQISALYQQLRAEARRRAGTHAVVTAEAVAVPMVKGYLPHPLTELVGREDERMEVALQLRRSRLVTLTGMGGIGKTRLAREVAGEVVREYADGVWLVALESLTEGRLVIQQVASVLGLREERGRTPLQSVTEHLRQKRLLLVLDNCEHLLAASAQVVAHLLRECGEVRILVTSREALGITGEMVWNVPALAVPDMEHLPQGRATLMRVLMGYESVQLFVERAQAMQKTFAVSGSNAMAVAQVCQQLEGIPLAIELAAARIRAMSIEQITSRLEDYMGFLTGGNRAAQSRQQTLRATLDWSYALLSEPERVLLRRLSVFAGGCLLEAAEQVCADIGWPILDFGLKTDTYDASSSAQEPAAIQNRPSKIQNGEILDLLTSLVDKSLVTFEAREQAEGRYRLLEMVRQYAAEGLQASGEAEQVKTRHRDWFLTLAEVAEPQLKGADQAIWWGRMETEHNNLRTALAWSGTEAQGAEAGLRLAGALGKFWVTRGHYSEGRACLSEVLGRDRALGRTKSRARALNGSGELAWSQGDYRAARELHEESLTISRELGDKAGIAHTLHHLGTVAYSQGDHEAARTLLKESLAIHRELGDKGGIAQTLVVLGNVAYSQSDYDAARTLYEESLAIRRELGDKAGIASTLVNLGIVASSQGDHEAARTLYEQSLAIQRELGNKRGIAGALHSLGNVAHTQGDYDAARTLLKESLAIQRELGEKWGISYSLLNLGNVARVQGDHDAARTLYEESLAIQRELGDRRGIAYSLINLGKMAYSQSDYDAARTLYEQCLTIRRELGDKAGIAFSLLYLGNVASSQGDHEAARTLYEESLASHREQGDRRGIASSLHNLGNVAYIQGDYDAARTLLKESLAIHRELGEKGEIVSTLESFAALIAAKTTLATEAAETVEGSREIGAGLRRATRMWGAAQAVREHIRAPLSPRERAEYDRQVAQARSALGPDAFATAWEEGRAMTLEKAVAYALEAPSEMELTPLPPLHN